MVIQIYKYIDNQRSTTVKQYDSYEAYERDYFVMLMAGTWVGHRIFEDIDLNEFEKLSDIEINRLYVKAYFDRDSYVKHYINGAVQ
jgi:hypothetical protein